MNEQQMASPEMEALKKLSGQINEMQNTRAKSEDVTALKNEFEKLQGSMNTANTNATEFKKDFDALKTKLEEIRENVNGMRDGAQSRINAGKSLGQMVVEKLKDISKGRDLTKLSKGERINFDLEVPGLVNKTVGTMTTANVIPVGTNAIPFTLSDAEPGLTRIVRRQPWILQIANTSTTDKMYVQYAEQTGPEGAANETAEGNDKNQVDFDWTERSRKVEKITAYIKVSKEMLADVDGLRAEIDTELRELVLLEADADLLSGDGTTPTIAGILTMDTAFSAGDLAGTITDPGYADVLRAAIAQVEANHFNPNYALLHPTDVAAMDLDKSTSDGHYLLPPFKSANGLMISGVQVIANTGQTVGSFTVGDFTKLNVRVREGFSIDIGHDGDDFIKNLVTILGEIRLASYIKANHVGAFVSGTFSDAQDDLLTS